VIRSTELYGVWGAERLDELDSDVPSAMLNLPDVAVLVDRLRLSIVGSELSLPLLLATAGRWRWAARRSARCTTAGCTSRCCRWWGRSRSPPSSASWSRPPSRFVSGQLSVSNPRSCRVRTSHLPGYSPAAAQPCAVPATGAAAAAAAAGRVAAVFQAAVFQVSGFSADDFRVAKRQAVKEHLAPMPPSDMEQPMQPRLLTA